MPAHHGNRYGRSEFARDSVLRAADDLLAEVGLAQMTMEGLAKRAGVSKQTIYRWWPRITDVLLDVVCHDAEQHLVFPDTGTLAGDVDSLVRVLAAFLAGDDAGKVLLSLRAHSQIDWAFRASFETRFLAEERQREEGPFRRAIERGDLPHDFDVATARQLVTGPLYAAAAEDRLTDEVVTATLVAWSSMSTSHEATLSRSGGADA